MSDSTPAPDEKQTADEIQADIEATRDRLAANVDALSEKLDVKAHAPGGRPRRRGQGPGDRQRRARSRWPRPPGAAAAQSRTLVEKFRALPLAAQAAIGAGAAALVVTLIVRSARS